jgi:hypothetical protein
LDFRDVFQEGNPGIKRELPVVNNKYFGPFPGGQSRSLVMKLITHLHLVLKLSLCFLYVFRMEGLIKYNDNLVENDLEGSDCGLM